MNEIHAVRVMKEPCDYDACALPGFCDGRNCLLADGEPTLEEMTAGDAEPKEVEAALAAIAKFSPKDLNIAASWLYSWANFSVHCDRQPCDAACEALADALNRLAGALRGEA
jgi:hypothetical protein